MAENHDGVEVTEEMLIEAAKAGDLERLTVWVKQGLRVTSAEPLFGAIKGGHIEVLQLLVQEMGADINQAWTTGIKPLLFAIGSAKVAVVQCLVELGADINEVNKNGDTLLMIAARGDNLAVVQCLIEFGAEVGAVNVLGNTALLESALCCRYAMMQYLLEEAGANMDDINNQGNTVWDVLTRRWVEGAWLWAAAGTVEAKFVALTGLLRVMVLRGAPPRALVARLAPSGNLRRVVLQEGARLRARLPAYLAHRRAYLDSRCPRISALPGVLRALIYTFEGPATTEELWATGLGTAVLPYLL
jgi:hypothetical protein